MITLQRVRYGIAVALYACASLSAQASATFSVVNNDSAGVGFNDTTAFTPTGGNNATTLGQARLNVLNEAGRIWGLRINSTQPILVEADFEALTCTSTSGTLASAGPVTFFTRSSEPTLIYPVAQISAITGSDASTTKNDISVTINSSVGTGASCLSGKSFYLGLDHNYGTNIDLLNVLLHELGHGLGFLSFSETTRNSTTQLSTLFTTYEQFIYSESLGKFWPAMTTTERSTASTASGTVTYNSASVNNYANAFTTSTGLSTLGNHLRLYAPSTFSSGSSISHWDSAVDSPNLLMEPFITANPNGTTDLTGCVLRDIGWTNATCPDFTAPTATSQTITTSEDTPLQFILSGNSNYSGRTLSYNITSTPAHGSVSTVSGSVFIFTPTANYSGSDSFSFQTSDGLGTSTSATVSINVTAVNDAPTANAL